VSCTGHDIPVALAAGQSASYHVWGELCSTPGERKAGATVQLLVHGATYDYSYWDYGTVDGVTYSYARDVAAAGIPTFAIDQLGSGWSADLPASEYSSYPASTDITIQVAAYVAHQVIQALKNGSATGTKFGKVVEVGHSFGSITATVEAATYNDAAGVILTGDAHSDTVFQNTAAADLYPADDDPTFQNVAVIDSGYLTTVPGTRGTLFYAADDSDPKVIADDENTKSTVSSTMFVTGLPVLTSDDTAAISVPVLVIDGQNDALFCGALVGGGTYDCSSGAAVAAQEAPYYSAAAQLRACVVPGSGHDVNLSLDHVIEEADTVAWTYEYAGQLGTGQLNTRVLPADCST
jgi:pimeloyl-ACP methyl ester carboxylesterase